MFPLKRREDLVLLHKELENLLPLSLKVYSSLLKILHGNPFQQEPLVDSWPEFNVVLVRAQKKGESTDSYSNSYLYFYKDIKRIPESFVETFDWTQAFEVQGIQCDLEEILVNAAQKRKTITEVEIMLTLLQKEGKSFSLPDERGEKKLQISSLTLSDAELVDKTWLYGGSKCSLQYVETCIRNMISCCCTIAGTENPISWAMEDQNGTIRMAYTMPEHRGKGYAKLVNAALSDLLRQAGRPVYCHVREENASSVAVYRSLGFEEIIGGNMLFFHSTPVQLLSSGRQGT